jgi:hypothetical protein
MTDQPLGEELLLDNGVVRVWTDRVAPGGEQPTHTHRNPYLSVTVTPVRAQVVDADGEVLYDVERGPGEVRWFDEVPRTHRLRNTGDGEAVVVVVEVLGGPEGVNR